MLLPLHGEWRDTERERERDEKHPNAAVCELGVNVGSLPLLLAYRPLKENSQNG